MCIDVYSSLFSSSLSNTMQCSSRKLMIGDFQRGERRKFMIMSKNQSYRLSARTYIIVLTVRHGSSRHFKDYIVLKDQ